MMKKMTHALVLACLACLAAITGASAAAGSEASDPRMVILGKETRYRAFLAFRTPVVVDSAGKVKTALQPVWNKRKQEAPQALGQYQSPLPPEAWNAPEFDDLAWRHCSAPVEVEPGVGKGIPSAMHSATKSSIIFLRSKFKVDDPTRVRDLKLTLTYVGGVAVYVNGKEVKRAHLPKGDLKADTLAENYPPDLNVLPGNDLVTINDLNPKWNRKNCKECQVAYQRRYRQLKDLAIDTGLLRKGANVLALRIHRAAVNEAATKASNPPGGARRYVKGISAYAGIKDLIVTAAPGSAIRPNTGRSNGVHIWNCTAYEDLSINSFGDPGDTLRPIAITAVRNGTFSGRFAIDSSTDVEDLKITLSSLRTADGKAELPAEAVRLRHARRAPWNLPWRKSALFDGLYEGAPARIARVKDRITLGWRKHLNVDGAVLPMWVTVRVPKDAVPGLYEGKVTVQARGLEKTKIPVKCRVYGWTLPDANSFLIHNLAVLSPENLAMHYQVPFWSERHFELMARSMRMMFETGSRRIEIDLAIDYHGMPGNTQTIVRWIKQPDGSFKHDFSVLDKYLDVVQKTIGKPRPLRLNCWGEFTSGKKKLWGDNARYVSVLDPKTGKLERYEQPIPGTPASIKFWKPVLDGIRQRAKERGWEDVLSLGHQSYCTDPPKEQVDAVHEMWPEAVWSFSSHNSTLGKFFSGSKGTRMPVLYGACVWTQGNLEKRGYKRLLARIDKPNIWTTAARDWYRDSSNVFLLRRLLEDVIMRGHNGVGQMGADLFPIEGKTKGRYWHHNYNRGGLGPEFSTRCILAAGKDGPIATERYEMFREGLQLCEIILRLQQMLDANKISGDLAKRVDDCLERRSDAYLGGYWEGQIERDRELLELAGEVGKAAGQPAK